MKIGFLRLELLIPGCDSLKAKRSIVKRYVNRLRREFNVGVAEIGNYDHRYSCCLGIVTIYNNNDAVENTLYHIVEIFTRSPDFHLKDYLIELI